MRLTRFLLLSGMFAAALLWPFAVSSQQKLPFKDDLKAQIEFYLSKSPDRQFQVKVSPNAPVIIPPELLKDIRYSFQKRMTLSGHGVLFDAEGRRVILKDAEIEPIQNELLKAALEAQPDPKLSPELSSKLKEFGASVEPNLAIQSKPLDASFVRHMLILAQANRLPDAQRSDIVWRAQYILNHHFLRGRRLEDLISQPLLLDWNRIREILANALQTSYMTDCRNAGVPVPPNFSITGSAWTRQGQLSQNILSPGNVAEVWTWAPPSGRGACVALPRRSGSTPGSPATVAGVICQSATTGNACFWDNLDRTTLQRIQWDVQPLKINQLQDGSNLAENCTNCHQGNNVYLVAPDDPTWCRLLRGGKPGSGCAAPGGADAANLTLRVEAAVNTVPVGGVLHPRYLPLSGTPARAGWVNNETAGCGGTCHLGGGAVTTPSPMPPACGVNCY